MLEEIKKWINMEYNPISDLEICEKFNCDNIILDSLKMDSDVSWKDYKIENGKTIILFWRKDYRDKNASFFYFFCE
jgi:hypothetical protein